MLLKVSVNSYDIKKFLVIAAFVSLFQKSGLLNMPEVSNLVNQEGGAHATAQALMSFIYDICLCGTDRLCLWHGLLLLPALPLVGLVEGKESTGLTTGASGPWFLTKRHQFFF